jgi:hypothetical protein
MLSGIALAERDAIPNPMAVRSERDRYRREEAKGTDPRQQEKKRKPMTDRIE